MNSLCKDAEMDLAMDADIGLHLYRPGQGTICDNHFRMQRPTSSLQLDTDDNLQEVRPGAEHHQLCHYAELQQYTTAAAGFKIEFEYIIS